MLAVPYERLGRLLSSPTLDLAARASMLAPVEPAPVAWFRTPRALPTDARRCANQWLCLARFSGLVPTGLLGGGALRRYREDNIGDPNATDRIGGAIAAVRGEALRALANR